MKLSIWSTKMCFKKGNFFRLAQNLYPLVLGPRGSQYAIKKRKLYWFSRKKGRNTFFSKLFETYTVSHVKLGWSLELLKIGTRKPFPIVLTLASVSLLVK